MSNTILLKDFLIILGKKIKCERESRGYTLDDLEFYSSIDSSDINKIELGQKSITLKTLVNIANELKMYHKDFLASDI